MTVGKSPMEEFLVETSLNPIHIPVKLICKYITTKFCLLTAKIFYVLNFDKFVKKKEEDEIIYI